MMFSLVLTRHRLWGNILIPYIFGKEPEHNYYQIKEVLFPCPSENILVNLLPEEREIVTLLNQYSERQLFRLFSKDKNVKEFVANVDAGRIENHIRPYIERRIFKCIEIAKNEAIPVFFQKSSLKSFHGEDILRIEEEKAIPVFRFQRTPLQSTYSLGLEIEGEPLNIRTNTEIISMSPCIVRCDNRLIFVSDIDGVKLRPFMTREMILIPKNSEKKYFSTFVLNAVNRFKVEAEGFRIIDVEPVKKAFLEIEKGLSGNPVIILSFSYSGRSFYASDREPSFAVFENEKGEFVFRKYARDFQWEEECIKILGSLGFCTEDNIHFFIPDLKGDYFSDLFATIESVNDCFEELTGAGFVINAKKLDKNYNLRPVNMLINHEFTGDWFDLRAKVKIGEYEIPFIRLRRNILDGKREYELPDGTIAILPEAWFTKYRNILEFGKAEDDSLKVHKQHFSLLADILEEKKPVAWSELDKLILLDSIPAATPPSGLKTELRKYQIEGLNWMLWLKSANLGGCLADDMGLGKTIQTLALLLYNRENDTNYRGQPVNAEPTLFDPPPEIHTSLVVVPASLVYNWENEIKRFVPVLKVYTYKGNQRKKSVSYFSNYDIILSSYHTVRQDVEIISSFHFHYIILDESQIIKNPSSMVFKAVSSLKSCYRLVLTGTPIENSLSDLWTQLNFVNPGLLGSLTFFRKEYAKPIEKTGDEKKEEQLKKIISPFILRRTKEMVASDLPPLTEQTIFCDMTEEQTDIYEREKSAVRNSILSSMERHGQEHNAIQVLQGLMRLRQLSNHPSILFDDYNGSSGKFESVTRDLENIMAENHRILVFSSFVKHLMLYAEYLHDKSIRYSILTGASTDRGRIIENFRNDPENRIFLISLKAGGLGLNLTSADYVLILDPWWNPAAEMQAFSRAHRIGQDKNVFVYRYISSATIEEKIIRLQQKKSRLADTFVQSNNPLKDIDIKSILDIIG